MDNYYIEKLCNQYLKNPPPEKLRFLHMLVKDTIDALIEEGIAFVFTQEHVNEVLKFFRKDTIEVYEQEDFIVLIRKEEE